tara:strand:- start:72 stop:1763 length:1692 start_codon:yes stop_codon:yes gene_type:complete
MSHVEKEYIVTVQKDVDWHQLYHEIIHDTSSDDSVDSAIVPDRPCVSANERPNNRRNTHYFLTDEEAISLRQDPRVLAVQALDEIPEPEIAAIQDGNFNRAGGDSGEQDNWGLLRHTALNNIYGSSFLDPEGAYDYVLDGTGVDIVIMDTGIQAGHPEWENKIGVSRLVQIDWYSASGVSGTQPANFYTDVSGHGTHCAGTMAGKTFGWAKNARIYSMTTYGNPGNSISFEDAVDCLIGWHNNKPIESSTGVKRPTIVNMSFQYSWYLDTSVTPNEVSFSSTGTGYDVTGGRYRGTAHSSTTRANLLSKGVIGSDRGRYLFGRKLATKDADVEQLIANGINVCTAAGNNYMKVDHPAGADYNNYLTLDISGTTRYNYYHRGSSPSVTEAGDTYTSTEKQDFTTNYNVATPYSPDGLSHFNDGFDVGSLDGSSIYSGGSYIDKKADFSESGLGVGIYAVGDNVISAYPNSLGVSYHDNSSHRQSKLSGTSMASPQMCGMMACLLQVHPDWTPAQVKNYFINNSQNSLYSTGSTIDYTTSSSLHGGHNRIAYLPMNGAKRFRHET